MQCSLFVTLKYWKLVIWVSHFPRPFCVGIEMETKPNEILNFTKEQRLSIVSSKELPKDVPNSPREQIVAFEDSSLWKTRRRPLKCIFKRGFACQMIKTAIFAICCAFFFIQSAEFYNHYYTYPTITNIVIATPENVTLPAITYCNKNMYV
ncbi:hypothetical protein CDAR_597791 [Caerostris darwini]|uniref:Uncharacterized protein n=1 Tax=Caerostris darwini TaxID=1538125 RepID=A0AAV4UF66_9ARAC|nr:hypothetical protein CDAR_597791 [Caerostris darwini]